MKKITNENLELIDTISKKSDIKYDFLGIQNDYPGEALIECDSIYSKKVFAHQLQKQGFFVSRHFQEAPTLISIFLVRRNELFTLKKIKEREFLAKVIVGLISFLTNDVLNLPTIKQSLDINQINENTEMVRFYGDSGEIETLCAKLDLCKLSKIMPAMFFENEIHVIASRSLQDKLVKIAYEKNKQIVEYIRTITNYAFILNNRPSMTKMIVNIGNKNINNRLLQELEQKYPDLVFELPFSPRGVNILTIEGTIQECYRNIYLNNPNPFSIANFLKNNTITDIGIEEVMDLVTANVDIHGFTKGIKSRKNNLNISFHNQNDIFLAMKILSSKGVKFEYKNGTKSLRVNVIEEFGLFSRDISINERKTYLENKYSVSGSKS